MDSIVVAGVNSTKKATVHILLKKNHAHFT